MDFCGVLINFCGFTRTFSGFCNGLFGGFWGNFNAFLTDFFLGGGRLGGDFCRFFMDFEGFLWIPGDFSSNFEEFGGNFLENFQGFSSSL